VFIGEHTSQRASRGVATSIPQFVVQHTDSQASETPIPDTGTIIKTSLTADVITQERHHDPESNPVI
jgi:hypothetical protein